jgi:hypothetical protein
MLLAITLFAGTNYGLMRVEDFGAYWGAAKLNVRGENPFDFEKLLRGHREINPNHIDVLPPWGGPGAIAVCTPLTPFPFAVARILWMATQIAILLFAAWSSWSASRGPPERIIIAFIVAISFYPVQQMVALGQVSIMNLLAVSGFLKFHRTLPYLAGLLCGAVVVKPQNMIPFEWAIILWCLHRREWKVVAGGLTTVGLALAVVLLPNPDFFRHYADALANRGPTDMVQPTLATWLRWVTGGAFWTSLVLPPAGIVIVTAMFWLRRSWDWSRELMWLVPLSFFCTPYGWLYDVTTMLVPVFMVIAASKWPVVVAVGFILISIPAFVMNILNFAEFQYGWFPVAVTLAIVIASRERIGRIPSGSNAAGESTVP